MAAVLGEESDALFHGLHGVLDFNLFALDVNIAGDLLIHAEDGAHHFAASGADQAEEAQDFALAQVEAHVAELLFSREVFHAQQLLAGFKVADVVDILHGTADHLVDEVILVHVLDVLGFHISAVFEDGDGIADFDDLLEAVGDIDHGDAVAFELADVIEQYFNLIVLQKSGGLVKDNKADFLIDGDFADGDHRLHGDGQGLDLGLGIDIHLELVDDLAALIVHFLPVDHAELVLGQASQEVVFGDAQVLSNIYMLVVGMQTHFLCIDGVFRDDPLAVHIHFDLAFRGRFDAHDAFDQRRFAGAIFANQCAHLALTDCGRNAFQGPHAWIILHNTFNPKEDVFSHSNVLSFRGISVDLRPMPGNHVTFFCFGNAAGPKACGRGFIQI